MHEASVQIRGQELQAHGMNSTSKVSDRRKFEQLLSEGLTAAKAAQQVGVALSTGYKWAHAAKGGSEGAERPQQFARLVAQSEIKPRIEIEVPGATIRVHSDVDPKVVAQLVALLRRV